MICNIKRICVKSKKPQDRLAYKVKIHWSQTGVNDIAFLCEKSVFCSLTDKPTVQVSHVC